MYLYADECSGSVASLLNSYQSQWAPSIFLSHPNVLSSPVTHCSSTSSHLFLHLIYFIDNLLASYLLSIAVAYMNKYSYLG